MAIISMKPITKPMKLRLANSKPGIAPNCRDSTPSVWSIISPIPPQCLLPSPVAL